MAAPTGPTVRRMQLGWELKRLREKSGFTLAQAVEGLTFSTSKLQRTENGLTALPKVQDLRALLDRYGVHDEEDVEFLVEVHRESLRRGWWSVYRNVMPSGMSLFVGLEDGARSIRAWQPYVMYGLLQTERYAKALLLDAKPVEEMTTEFVEYSTYIRMGRKAVLTRKDSPVDLWVIMDEGVLRRVVGGPEVMCEQYEELIRLTKRDNVTVQILPLSASAYRAEFDFCLMDFGTPLPTIAQMDVGGGGSNMTDKKTEVWKFTRRFDSMRAAALSPGETPTFIHRLARELT